MKKDIIASIISEIYEKGSLTLSAVIKHTGGSPKNVKKIKKLLDALIANDVLSFTKGSYHLVKRGSIFKAEIKQVFRAHGFIRCLKSGNDFFVPGKYLCGGVPGDIVLARPLEKETGTARVIVVIKESENILIGTIIADGNRYSLLPNSFISEPVPIMRFGKNIVKHGDKVAFTLHERGARHNDHIVNITSVYGNADSARVSSRAYLDEKNMPNEFPNDVLDEAVTVSAKGINRADITNRLDLTAESIFTIDGADTKDIDDAVSIKKTENGFELGVHIADVSHYVRRNSPLDKEALLRGTSVYIADLVIPMLPKELSNGICSLNPGENRLAFSCLMNISKNGELKSFEFVKSLIKSRVQGVYSEVNQILSDFSSVSSDVKEKYSEVINQLEIMKELADILKNNRKKRSAPMLSSKESKIICDENGMCLDIKARTGGISENIIEEFMLIANNAAARLAMRDEIPFIYRIHEPPTAEKLTALNEALTLIGIKADIGESSTAADFAHILAKHEKDERFDVINNMILRSMMKAAYSPEPVGHFGLVMKEYAHFTSPIRRYPDLFIHRVLSDFVNGLPDEKLQKRYRKASFSAAARSSSMELSAVSAERDCVKFYMAEFMKKHIGEEFDGVISGVAKSGIFVMLENTVEGRISTASLSGGLYENFETINNAILRNMHNGTEYIVGSKVRVKCERVFTALGMIDFILI